MQVGKCAVALLFISSLDVAAMEAPLKDAQAAVDVAKAICRDQASPVMQWEAELAYDGTEWLVSTRPSAVNGDYIWLVELPVNGPRPTKCEHSLYIIKNPKPNSN